MGKIVLKGANNARDFGGIKNREGKTIKPDCFLRSNKLDKLNKNDIETLKSHRIKTIIDLRTKVEMTDAPDVTIDGVKHIHVPIYSEEVMGITHENNQNKIKMLDYLPDMSKLYSTMVTKDECIAQLKRAFDVITKSDGSGSILWHCTEGKDRCGLVSALFLIMLDVDIETVFEDYLETNVAAVKRSNTLYYLVKYLLRRKEEAEKVREIFLAKREYLAAAINTINEKWGGTDEFIRNKLGVSDEVKEMMKEKFLLSEDTEERRAQMAPHSSL